MVPISIATSANPSEAAVKVVLDAASTTVTVENVKPDQWVKVRPIIFIRDADVAKLMNSGY